jgi:cyanophycinase
LPYSTLWIRKLAFPFSRETTPEVVSRPIASTILLISALAFAPRAATLTAAQRPSPPTSAAPEYGPPNGTLFIGGGSTLGLPLDLIEKFVELGGGRDGGRFVIVPTANGNLDATGAARVYVESQVIGPWVNLVGLKHVKMLHTHDPQVANTTEFARVLSDATAVWFTGGRHHHIVDSYAGTLTYQEFHKVLARGGVIGGSSAGATIQGDYLVRGDSRTNTIVMTDEPNHQKGFEFLRKSAIDQHIDARNRWDDLIPVIERFPNLLGIGLSEDTAIVVKGDRFEVFGRSQVAIHDNTQAYGPWARPYYLLEAGDTYNMRTRRVVKGTARPRSSAASAPPAVSVRLAEPSGTAVSPSPGTGSVPAPIPSTLARLIDRLLMVAGVDESWDQIEVVDVDSDGAIDLVRIHLISGDTVVWEVTSSSPPGAAPSS